MGRTHRNRPFSGPRQVPSDEPSRFDYACERTGTAYDKACTARAGKRLPQWNRGSWQLSAEDDLEVERWSNEVIAELRAGRGLREALSLANRPVDGLGDEELPVGWSGPAPTRREPAPELVTPFEHQRPPRQEVTHLPGRRSDKPALAVRMPRPRATPEAPARVLVAPERGPAQVVEVTAARAPQKETFMSAEGAKSRGGGLRQVRSREASGRGRRGREGRRVPEGAGAAGLRGRGAAPGRGAARGA